MSVAQLSSDLQSALAEREDTAALLADVEAERDQYRDQILLLEDQQAQLTQTLNEMRQEVARAEDLEAELQRSVDLRARLQEELEKARQTVTSDRATIETQLAQLVQLRRDIEALQKVRGDLEREVAEMTGLLSCGDIQGRCDQGDRAPGQSARSRAGADRQSADPGRGAEPDRHRRRSGDRLARGRGHPADPAVGDDAHGAGGEPAAGGS